MAPTTPVDIDATVDQQLVLVAAFQDKLAKSLADPACKPGSKEFREVTLGLSLADRLLQRARLFRRK